VGLNGKWQVHTKGGPEEAPFEICVIREDNEHGKRSYGWFGGHKRLISSSGGPCRDVVTWDVWTLLFDVAQKTADRLNAQDKLQRR